jgi:hypothetical protein
VVAFLTKQSCIPDLTADLSKAEITTRPIAHGGLADIYRATMPDGQYAIKCLRQRNNKELKARVASLLNHRISHLDTAYRSGAERVVEAQAPPRARATRTGRVPWLPRYGVAVDGVWQCHVFDTQVAEQGPIPACERHSCQNRTRG